MKHKKTAALLFAVTLGLTALTACTEQSDSKEAASTAAESSVVSTEEGLTTEDAALFFEPLAAVVHGYASLIANNGMKYDPDAIRKALIMLEEGMGKGNKKND